MLSTLQYDALREHMNIAIGHAASLLSEIVNRRVELAIPRLQIVEYDDMQSPELPQAICGHMLSSAIQFGPSFSGRARLVFPLEKVRVLLAILLEEDVSFEEVTEFNDTDLDALREVGNIVLNAVMGGLGNLMNIRLHYRIPEVEVLRSDDIYRTLNVREKTFLLVIHNTFTLKGTPVEGAIIVVLDLASITLLLESIDAMVAEYFGE